MTPVRHEDAGARGWKLGHREMPRKHQIHQEGQELKLVLKGQSSFLSKTGALSSIAFLGLTDSSLIFIGDSAFLEVYYDR